MNFGGNKIQSIEAPLGCDKFVCLFSIFNEELQIIIHKYLCV